MKRIWSIVSLLLISLSTLACPVCEQQQPKLLRGITHGAGPSSNWDYVIIAAAVIVVLVTLFFTVKWLVRPGEKGITHIKRTVLNFN
jgi:uncharacterized protein HemY